MGGGEWGYNFVRSSLIVESSSSIGAQFPSFSSVSTKIVLVQTVSAGPLLALAQNRAMMPIKAELRQGSASVKLGIPVVLLLDS